MTALKVYRGKEALSSTLSEIDAQIEALTQQQRSCPPPSSPVEMLEYEQKQRLLGYVLSDLFIARGIVLRHFEPSFRHQAIEQSKEAHHEVRNKALLENRGLRLVTVLLPGGLRLEMFTPYLSPSRKGLRGRPRGTGKRGRNGAGVYPVLEALGVADGATPLTRSEVARQTVLCSSYAEAQEQLGRGGLHLDQDTLVRLATGTGEQALQLRTDALSQAFDEPLPEESMVEGQRLRVSVDGGRARIRKTNHQARKRKNGRRPFKLDWCEPRVITVDILDEKGRRDHRWRPIYEVALGEADEVFLVLCGLLRLIGAYQADEVVFVSDGAEWIWNRVEQLFDPALAGLSRERVHLVLDYYHASEYIAKALKVCKNLNQERRGVLHRKFHKMLLEEDGPAEVLAQLKQFARGRRARKVNKSVAYLEGHLEHMKYAELREAHVPIGSGVVESTVRRVINLRFKNASMCWCKERLEPLMYLRAILKSGRWDDAMMSQLEGRHYLHHENSEFTGKVA